MARVTDAIKKKSKLTKEEWREFTKTGMAYCEHKSQGASRRFPGRYSPPPNQAL